jgi:AraC-like DNA-binding protein
MSEQPMTITAFGQTMTLYQWAQETGMSRSTLRSRIEYGWDPERALTEEIGHDANKPRMFTAFGETLSVRDWSRRTGIPLSTLKSRLYDQGLPPDVAMAKDDEARKAYRNRHIERRRHLAKNLYKRSGKSIQEIAKITGRAPNTICVDLRIVGVSLSDERKRNIPKAWRMFNKGMTLTDIGKNMGKHRTTISQYIRLAMREPTLRNADFRPEYCDCGESATICVQVKIRQGAKEVLNLCPSCYDLFIETEC